jgi:hypothetical protein
MSDTEELLAGFSSSLIPPPPAEDQPDFPPAEEEEEFFDAPGSLGDAISAEKILDCSTQPMKGARYPTNLVVCLSKEEWADDEK